MSRNSRHIVLLQGPLGSFFKRLAREFMSHGDYVTRVCFNGGDEFYAAGDHIIKWNQRPEAWKAWLRDFVIENSVDTIILYGDSRYYHKIARRIGADLDVPVLCLEEGYLRPGYVTAEWGGNNANSPLMGEVVEPEGVAEPPAEIEPTFGYQAWSAIIYYHAKAFRLYRYRHYKHHRPGSPLGLLEIKGWVTAWPRKYRYQRHDRKIAEELIADYSNRYYLVPLQVAVDSQVTEHSRFDNIPDFIEEVMSSFATYAEKSAMLVIKHHPMDRGFHHYGDFIQQLAIKNEVEDRVVYGFQFDLDILLEHARGCVTINSTVGISAIEIGIPTVTLSNVLYNGIGLATHGNLDKFWPKPVTPDNSCFRQWRSSVIKLSLLAGSFYSGTEELAEKIRAKIEVKTI